MKNTKILKRSRKMKVVYRGVALIIGLCIGFTSLCVQDYKVKADDLVEKSLNNDLSSTGRCMASNLIDNATETAAPLDDMVQNIEINNGESLKISIMNDFHYFSKELYSECEDFNYDCKAEKKLLLESDAILNKVIEKIKRDKPDVILVGGDMVKDGERINHELVSLKLEAMEEDLRMSGLNTQIYVTNGNHDINANARDYSTGQTVYIPSVTPAEFKELYDDLGFGEGSKFYNDTPGQGGGLSYVTDIGKGFTLIVVDTNKYTADQTKTGLDKAEVGGMISDNLLSWVSEQAREAYLRGNVPIVLQHHPIAKHFTTQEVLGKNFIIDDRDKISSAYAQAGINIVFTGHSHASDIAKVSYDGKDVYDVMTSSTIGYPVTTRTVNLSVDNNQDRKLKFSTDVHFYNKIEYIDETTGANIKDVQTYAYDRLMSPESTMTTLSDKTVKNALESIKTKGGTKTILANMLKVDSAQVTDEVANIIINKLPKTVEEGIDLKLSKLNFKVYYNEELKAISIKQITKRFDNLALEVYIPIEELKLLIEEMYTDIDNNILNNPEQVCNVFEDIALAANNKKINGKYSAIDIYLYIYKYYKLGQESPDDLLEDYANGFLYSDKSAKKLIKNVIYKSSKKNMVKLLSKNKLPLEKVIKVGNNSITSKVVVKVITSSFDDMSDVWTKVIKRVLYSDKVIDKADKFCTEIITGMVKDVDVTEDNNAVIEINLIY